MYWYIKYPLLALLALAILGIAGSIFRSCAGGGAAEGDEGTVAPDTGVVVVDGGGEGGEASGTAGTPTVQGPAGDGNVTAAPVTPNVVPGVIPELETLLETARMQQERGMLEASRVLAQRVLQSSQVREFDKYWLRAAQQINDVNRKLMNSTAPVSEKKGYRVVRGDSLQRIANRFHTTIGALLRMNPDLRRDDGRDPIIRPSQTILYISGKWSIKVSKQHFLLILYFNDELYRVYTVGIGKDNRTPAGNFLITSTLAEPAWTPPGRNIPFGDPENVLGTRWLKLTPTAGTDPTLEGYGIHGTWEPDSVGSSCSAGCVRMRNEEVEELFDFIPVPGASTPPVKVLIQE